MKYCKRCITPSTRPRITFDENGICNACNWHEQKKQIDWAARREAFGKLCDRFRNPDRFDVVVPCSGGKDGSTVAYKLKHEFYMNPLCITFKPQIQTYLGKQNLENFVASGFDHLLITPDPEKYRRYARESFVVRGMPKQPFVTGISTALFQTAFNFKIQLLIYGEEGESEYGGSDGAKEKIDRDYLLNYYYEGENPTEHGPWWRMPSQTDLNFLYPTHWSKFFDWDPEENARFAKDHCGLQMMVGGSIGTFTNYSQLDDILQDLHAFLMFVKFGFGRCTSDASIEVRKGRMSRQQAVKVANRIDGQFPVEYLPAYLDYFDMTEHEFWSVINQHVNWEILKKSGRIERPFILKQEIT